MQSSTNAGNNPDIERLILVIPESKNAQIFTGGLNSRTSLNQRMMEDIKMLRKLTHQPLPYVKFGQKFNLSEDEHDMYRIIIADNENDVSGYHADINTSHIVLALLVNKQQDTIIQHFVEGFDCAVDFDDEINLDIIIRSIAMDISMSHYYHLCGGTVADKRSLSKAKIEYLRIDSRLTYACFALKFFEPCKKKGFFTFDYEKFLKKWDDFFKWHINNMLSARFPKTDRTSQSSNFIVEQADQILRSHPNKAQIINAKHFASKLSKLETGSYIFVRLNRHADDKNKTVLQSLFGKKKLRIGLTLIVDIRRKYEFERYNQYLHLHYFYFVNEMHRGVMT